MKSDFLKIFTICLAMFFTARLSAQETNSAPAANTNDIVNAYIQLQAQLHAAQLQIEVSREENAALSQSNLEAMNARIQQLEQTLATQRTGDLEIARRTQQLTMYLVAIIGLAGLAVLLLAGYFQWRAFSQLAEITARHSAMFGTMEGVHQLAAPGRATVETSNVRLLEIVGQLEKKIHDLETGGKLLAQPAASANPLAEGQKFLDANEPQRALDAVEKFLAANPQHAEAWMKKASALEKLGLTDEAIDACNRAIAANGSLVIAYLQKGGLLNRLERYDEALKCYEQAMLVQDKKAAPKN
jgi:tetratricopeptide (TPR) repeat protein